MMIKIPGDDSNKKYFMKQQQGVFLGEKKKPQQPAPGNSIHVFF